MSINHRPSFGIAVVVAIVLLCTIGIPLFQVFLHNEPGSDVPPTSDQSIAYVESSFAAISTVVDDTFRSINEGEFEPLYENATATRFREITSLVDFQSYCERVRSRLGAILSKDSQSFEVNPVGDGVVATVSFRAQFERGAGTILVVAEKQDDNWRLLRLIVNVPELLDDPTQFREMVELLVEDSDPVLPGTSVDILDSAVKPPMVAIENVLVVKVRWRVSGPSQPRPQAPASGFVIVSLTKDQAIAVKGIQMIAVRRHDE